MHAKLVWLLIGTFLLPVMCAGQGASGGVQGVPPFADQVGTNESPNPTFSGNLNGWTVPFPATVQYDGTVTHTADGTGSAKWIPGNGVHALQARGMAVSGMEFFEIKFWVKSSAGFDGGNSVNIAIEDVDHQINNSSFLTTDAAPGYGLVAAASDWVQVGTLVAAPLAHRNDTNWFVDIQPSNSWTTGNMWVDDVTIAPAWFPIRTFLLYPNFHGYLWTDKTPLARYCGGSPALMQVCGVSELVAQAGAALSSDTLTVVLATAAGCGSGVVSTKTFAAPSATQKWTFDGSGLTVGTSYFLCSKLTVTAGGALVDAYNDWKIVPENVAFRNALANWIDVDGAIVTAGTKYYAYGTYDRISGTFGSGSATPLWSSNTCTPSQSSAKNCYLNDIQGPGPNNVTPAVPSGIPSLTYYSPNFSPTRIRSMQYEGDNTVMWDIIGASAIDPRGGSDQLSPLLDALHSDAIYDMQEVNNWWGNPIDGLTKASVSPTFAPTVTLGAGSITANFLFIEASATAYSNGQGGGGGGAGTNETLVSSVLTENFQGATCAGTNCSAQFTTPACATTKQTGWYIYTATAATSTPPAQSAFQRQYANGPLFGEQETPCSSSVTLSTLLASNMAPPGADGTEGQLPGWTGGTTSDVSALGTLAATFINGSHPGGLGFYIEDEPSTRAVNLGYFFNQQLVPNANGTLLWCALFSPAAFQMWRDLCDIVGSDPYYTNFGVGTVDQPYVPAANGTNNCTAYTTNNSTASFTCWPDRADSFSDDAGNLTYGSRPNWNVVQQYEQSTQNAIPYAILKQEAYKVYIACSNRGSVGCGVMKWGMVSQLGLEIAYASVAQGGFGDTSAYTDSVTFGNEFNGLSPILTVAVSDSPILNGGSGQVDGAGGETVTGGAILSKVKTDTSASSACGSGSVYANSTNYPFGPVRFVAKTGTDGKQYILVTNLCSVSWNGTFTAANLPAGTTQAVVYGEARNVSISSGAWTDNFAGFDTHVYVLSQAGSNPSARPVGFLP